MRSTRVRCVPVWAVSAMLAVAAVASVAASANVPARSTPDPQTGEPAQVAPGVPVIMDAVVSLSTDTVGQGDVFHLSVGLPVPPGSAVYFPDTVPLVFSVESFRPVTWSVGQGAQGMELTLTYPLIAFRVGLAPVSGLDVYIGPAAGVRGERLPDGSVVGSWTDVESGSVPRARLTRAAVARQDIWVSSAIELVDITDGLDPRPPADVLGADWNRPSVAAILVLSVLLLAVAASVARELRPDLAEAIPPEVAPQMDSASVRWQKALDELDRILALGLHREGRTDEFYRLSSGVVRTFVEDFEEEWRSSLTSSELMRRLEARTNGSAPELFTSMRAAEVVKFGRLRPDASIAEGHWRALKSWVHRSGAASSSQDS